MNNVTRPTNGAGASARLETLALLTFNLAGQEYGLPVTTVVRIIEMVTIMPLPDMPDMIQGIINLHGKAVPVMDLRRRFGLPAQAYGLHTPIILVDVDNNGRKLGLIADMVEQVLHVPTGNLEAASEIMPTELIRQPIEPVRQRTRPRGDGANYSPPLTAVARVNRQMIFVLDVGALLTVTERVKLSQLLDDTANFELVEEANSQR